MAPSQSTGQPVDEAPCRNGFMRLRGLKLHDIQAWHDSVAQTTDEATDMSAWPKLHTKDSHELLTKLYEYRKTRRVQQQMALNGRQHLWTPEGQWETHRGVWSCPQKELEKSFDAKFGSGRIDWSTNAPTDEELYA